MNQTSVASLRGWRGWGRRFTAVFGFYIVSGIGACADLPTAAEPPTQTVRRSSGAAAGAGVGGTIDVVCRTSVAMPSRPYAYEYGILTVKLPASARSLDGSMRQYRYRGYVNGAELMAVAHCLIPNSAKAVEKMHHFFRVPAQGRNAGNDGGAQLMSTGDEPIMLEPIDAVACPYGDPTGYPNCSPREPMELPVEYQQCNWWDGCGGGGTYVGGGGGSSPTPTKDYEEGPLLWAGCVLGMVSSTYTIWLVADKFEAWHKAYKDAEGAQRLWQATVESGADPFIQQLYEYQYKQAWQRQQDAVGAVSEATGATVLALIGAGIACGATVLIPSP